MVGKRGTTTGGVRGTGVRETRTQEERKAETRARLLSAAADLFADQGIDAVSVDAVAEEAGRTSGAVYAHFGSKQGLLLALLDSWKDSVFAAVLAEVAVRDSPTQQLAAVWGNVGGRPSGGMARWHLLEHELWLRAVRDPEVATVLRARRDEARRISANHLRQWTAAVGARPPGNSEATELAVLVRALLVGLAMERAVEPALVDEDLAVRGLSALLGLDRSHRPTLRGDRETDGRKPAGKAGRPPSTVTTQPRATDRSTS